MIDTVNQKETLNLNLETDADLIISEDKIDQAIIVLAKQLNDYFNQPEFSDQTIVAYCVMNGGLYFSGQLLRYLSFPLQLSYLHASRYGNNTSGSELHWTVCPTKEYIEGNHVILLDDIFDQGLTLEAIDKECRSLGAASVHSVVLTDKLHHIKPTSGFKPDFVGLEVENRYIFGCGMDYQGLYRNLPAIYALKS